MAAEHSREREGMFATPRTDSGSRSRGSRRSLEWNNSGQADNSEEGSPDRGNAGQEPTGDSEMLTILRGLQQQVSALQAQQNQVVSERASSTPSATTPRSANEKRKLPKELTVSAIMVDISATIITNY